VWGRSAPPVILPRSPQWCQDCGLSVSSSIVETERSRRGQVRWVGWVGTTVTLFLVKNCLEKKKCETVRCRDATASSLRILYEHIIYTIYICNPQSQLFLFVCCCDCGLHIYIVYIICSYSIRKWPLK
jgi:hypothetical protein